MFVLCIEICSARSVSYKEPVHVKKSLSVLRRPTTQAEISHLNVIYISPEHLKVTVSGT